MIQHFLRCLRRAIELVLKSIDEKRQKQTSRWSLTQKYIHYYCPKLLCVGLCYTVNSFLLIDGKTFTHTTLGDTNQDVEEGKEQKNMVAAGKVSFLFFFLGWFGALFNIALLLLEFLISISVNRSCSRW